MQDIETICVAVLNRLKNESSMSEQQNVGTRLDTIPIQCEMLADFLAEHLTGQKAVDFAIRFSVKIISNLDFFVID